MPPEVSVMIPRAPVVWIDGVRQAPGTRHLSALDRGLTLADGIFETMRAYDGVVFRLEEHIARLARGATALELALRPDLPRIIVDAVLDAGLPGNHGVRVTLTRGPGGAGAAPPVVPACAPTHIVTVSAVPDFPAELYERGISAHVVDGRRNGRAMTAGIKTLAYTDTVAALMAARRAGADDALFLDTDDHCSEGGSSNLFVYTGDALLTPALSCGALPGITRAIVIRLARSLGVNVDESVFPLGTLLQAREAFLTSSLRELAPLVRVDRRPIGDGRPGALTRDLMTAYRSLVASECRGA